MTGLHYMVGWRDHATPLPPYAKICLDSPFVPYTIYHIISHNPIVQTLPSLCFAFEKLETESYLNKNVRSLIEDNPGKAYRSLKKMSSQPGDCEDETSFTLLSHIEDKLTSTESIERIADYFSQISQEYPPLNINLLPADVKVKILTPVNPDELTQLSDYEVYEKIRKSKKPRSNVPGDLPRRIVQEFGPELATPACIIFRNITKSWHWPKQPSD